MSSKSDCKWLVVSVAGAHGGFDFLTSWISISWTGWDPQTGTTFTCQLASASSALISLIRLVCMCNDIWVRFFWFSFSKSHCRHLLVVNVRIPWRWLWLLGMMMMSIWLNWQKHVEQLRPEMNDWLCVCRQQPFPHGAQSKFRIWRLKNLKKKKKKSIRHINRCLKRLNSFFFFFLSHCVLWHSICYMQCVCFFSRLLGERRGGRSPARRCRPPTQVQQHRQSWTQPQGVQSKLHI